MPFGTATDWLVALGIAVGIIGLVILILTRWRPDRLEQYVLAGVGPVSRITWSIVGLSLIGAGYHIFVHAAGLPQFRAPLWVALAVCAVVSGGSLLVDAMDNRHSPSDEGSDADP